MAFTSLLVTENGPVTTIMLNRPQVMNAFNMPMHFEMQAALDDFATDPERRVCVIRGAGDRAFCAGSDLKYAAAMHDAGQRVGQSYPPSGHAGLTERFDLTKPLIAAVNGFAMGGSFEIALACDLIIASSTARFGLPEPVVGQIAIGGGIHRLARQIGLKRALGMALTGEIVDAKEGLALGFVNEVAPPDELDATVTRWVDAILRGAPTAIRATKECIYRGLEEPSLAEAIVNQETYGAVIDWRASDDPWEGAHAFAEKRVPKWTER